MLMLDFQNFCIEVFVVVSILSFSNAGCGQNLKLSAYMSVYQNTISYHGIPLAAYNMLAAQQLTALELSSTTLPLVRPVCNLVLISSTHLDCTNYQLVPESIFKCTAYDDYTELHNCRAFQSHRRNINFAQLIGMQCLGSVSI